MRPLELKSADGTRLRAYRWEPEAAPTAEVLLCHGLAEHMGRYEHIARALTDRGWGVTGVELRGHGHSDGKRGHVARWADYTSDLQAAADTIDGPFAVLCHSMGGLVTLDWLRSTPSRVLAVASCAPLLGAKVAVPRWKLSAAGLLSRLLPSLSMANEIPTTDICTDAEVCRAYDADPLVYGTVTPRWFTEHTAAIGRVSEHAGRYTTPLFLHWGTGERIVNPESILEFAGRYGALVETRAWPGLFHECMNEPNRAEVIGAAADFLAPYLVATEPAAAAADA